MFHDAQAFPFTAMLEAHWSAIRAEFDALTDADYFDWYEPNAHAGIWRICGLYVVEHPEARRVSAEIARRCPTTVDLASRVTGVNFAAFSLMGPRAIIHPHRDVGKAGVLRAHLGVKVPSGCLFQVGDEQREWREGESLVFDGSTPHAAWNHSDEPRAVLLVEFSPPSRE